MKVTVATFANNAGSYPQLAARQKLNVYEYSSYEHTIYNSFESVGCKPHSEYPYAFKPYAINKEIEKGSDIVLWIDSPVNPVQNFDAIIDLIIEKGVLLVNNLGYSIASYTNDNCLDMMGMSRKVAEKHPMVMACIMGFDMRNETAKKVFSEYIHFAHTDAYKGSWENHRHDQSVISILAVRNNIELLHPKGIIAYKDDINHRDWLNDAYFISNAALAI